MKTAFFKTCRNIVVTMGPFFVAWWAENSIDFHSPWAMLINVLVAALAYYLNNYMKYKNMGDPNAN